MACAGKPQGKTSKTMGTLKKGGKPPEATLTVLPPPLRAIVFSPSEGLWMLLSVMMGNLEKLLVL